MLGDDRLGLPMLPLLPPPPPPPLSPPPPPPIPPAWPVGPPTCWLWFRTLRLLMGRIPLQRDTREVRAARGGSVVSCSHMVKFVKRNRKTSSWNWGETVTDRKCQQRFVFTAGSRVMWLMRANQKKNVGVCIVVYKTLSFSSSWLKRNRSLFKLKQDKHLRGWKTPDSCEWQS